MRCDFCGMDIESGTECIYVDAAGKATHFCSSKCEKNILKLKRKPQKVRWTQRYLREKAIRVRSIAEKTKATPKKQESKEEKHGESEKKAEKPKANDKAKPKKKTAPVKKPAKKTGKQDKSRR